MEIYLNQDFIWMYINRNMIMLLQFLEILTKLFAHYWFIYWLFFIHWCANWCFCSKSISWSSLTQSRFYLLAWSLAILLSREHFVHLPYNVISSPNADIINLVVQATSTGVRSPLAIWTICQCYRCVHVPNVAFVSLHKTTTGPKNIYTCARCTPCATK